MTAAHAEVCIWNEPWQRDFQVYGGRVCNTLMEGELDLLLYICRAKVFYFIFYFLHGFVDSGTGLAS